MHIYTHPKPILWGHSIQPASYCITLRPTSSLHLFLEFHHRGLPVLKCQRSFQQMSKWPRCIYSYTASGTNNVKGLSINKEADMAADSGWTKKKCCCKDLWLYTHVCFQEPACHPWWCAPTTPGWRSLLLWSGLSLHTTSPCSSGALSLILLWVFMPLKYVLSLKAKTKTNGLNFLSVCLLDL